MKLLSLISAALLSAVFVLSGVRAQSQKAYVPSLGDVMGTTQLRHIKLWFAGKFRNWPLAAYELEQVRASFVQVAMLYEGIPAANISMVSKPFQLLDEAIKAEDGARFARAFDDLTNACNNCHQSIQRGFIIIKTPADSPFSNQSFAPVNDK
jgi:hypothetical protein